MWFKINQPDADAFQISSLITSDYVKLKNSDKYAYNFVKELVDSCKISIFPDKIIECIWRSIDDVDYSKNKSKTWEYFTPINPNLARCKFCQSMIKTSGNTTNLRSHLNSKHKMFIPVDMQVNIKKRTAAAVEEPSSSTVERKKLKTQTEMSRNPVLELYERANSYADGGIEAEKLTNSLLNMITVDYMPLCSVEKPGLRQFVKTARPRYTMPCRKTITKLMNDKYDVLKLKVMSNIDKCPFYSLTSDIWTDISQTSYLGVTVHYLSANNLKVQSTNLCVELLDSAHTAKNIANALKTIIKNYNLNMNKIVAMTSDSTPNMIKSINTVFEPEKDRRLPCFAHRLSHVIPAAVLKMSNVQEIIDKVKRIVTVTRKSGPASDELLRRQKRDGKTNSTALKFIQSVETRWNSTYDMRQRFLLLENYVYPVTSKCSHPPPLLSHEETNILKDLVNSMKPVMIIISKISGDSYLTCSMIIPSIAIIKKEIKLSKPKTQEGVAFKAHLSASLDKQFNDIESFKILSIATILDPRYKKLHFQSAITAANAIELINKQMKTNFSQSSGSKSVSTEMKFEEELNEDNIWRYHDELVIKTKAKVHTTDGLSFELKQYITQPIINRSKDPLKHWQLLKPSFPNLYEVAMKYFCVVGTSVPCERLFSEAGNIKNTDRNRLTGSNLNKLLFLSSLSREEWGL
ncbi:E3 SUMO-protein ligase ZBED1 isoform X2 [Microplitis demolitor]|nr:E3 SUMO-protein ligase ZBED1 isoform X2 [Microplitis demolitor]XP_053594571.1 E3 SUMO-protein ligase ZBED1 isoform X2 [Microplitis demolitor]XP_053594572.1 E3 SUMO-protein ligase ZBED1 isoform X2 [Microplitis demolitor]